MNEVFLNILIILLISFYAPAGTTDHAISSPCLVSSIILVPENDGMFPQSRACKDGEDQVTGCKKLGADIGTDRFSEADLRETCWTPAQESGRAHT